MGGDLRAYALVCGGKGGSGAGARAAVSRAGCHRCWEARRGEPVARQPLDSVPRENHSSASAASVRLLRTGWVEPALGPRRRFCSLPFCPVYKSAVRYIER